MPASSTSSHIIKLKFENNYLTPCICMLQCKCETGGFANTLNSWWIRENTE